MEYEYKGFIIKPHKELPSNYIIVTQGQGGKIPDVMSGLFTSTGIAKGLVDRYLESKEKGKKNNEATTESGS